MDNSKIPLSDLPVGNAGPFDKIAGVDAATGAARLFPFPSIEGMRGYATKAALDADLAHPPGTLALVTNDPAPENNGTYRKVGAVGSGSWAKSADRLSAIEGQVAVTDLKAGADARIVARESAIDLDLNAGLLRITRSIRAHYGRTSFLIPSQDVPLPTSGQETRVVADIDSGAVSFSSATSTPANHVSLGSYTRDTTYNSYRLIGFPPHLVNGESRSEREFGKILTPAPNRVNFDLGTRTLTLDRVRVNASQRAWDGVTASASFPANATQPYRLVFDPAASDQIRFVSTAAVGLGEGVITLGWVRFKAGGVDVFGIDEYEVVGGDPGEDGGLNAYEGTLVAATSGEFINFDWGARVLRITGSDKVRCFYARNQPYVPNQDAPLPVAPLDGRWNRILYDTETGAISFAYTTDPTPPKSIIVGHVRPSTQSVYGIPDYYENGRPRSGGGVGVDSVEWLPVDGPTEPRFTLPALLPDFKAFGEFTNTDHTTAYALYDALVTAYPDYVSRTSLGEDDAGNTIYRYDFKPPADSGREGIGRVPGRLAKMILISGVHGYERAGVYCLYSALQQVCSRWQDDELLDTLHWNCHFIVIPMAVPHAFTTAIRYNPNGVDIARNFTALWSAGLENPGPFPLSEKESQYIDAVMAANRDAIYCGSFHNFLDTVGAERMTFIWNASATRFGIRLAQRLVSKLSRKWWADYAWLPQTHLIGYSDDQAPPGSEGQQSTLSYGIQGGTFEISRALYAAPDPDSYSQYVNTLGTEAVVNWLLMNLEHGAALYNGRGS